MLAVFNSDPEVIDIGYTRLKMVFFAYIFSMLYDVMSGYLRGFGISLAPAILTTIGVCGVRIAWRPFWGRFKKSVPIKPHRIKIMPFF